nr:thioredoxin-dependent thiol peroxidase [Paraferrimonas haliotis]
MKPIQAGARAPQFSLPDQNGEQVALADYLGQKVLVYFYPKASTPGCTVQACALRDARDELAEKNVKVIGISPDPTKRLKNFETKQSLNFSLVGDEDHQVCEAFGIWGEKKFMGKVYDGVHRISFLINEKGMVEKVFDKFKTKDHHQVVLDYLNGN